VPAPWARLCLCQARLDDKLARPAETIEQREDARLAREVLGWQRTVGFDDIVRRMVEVDLANLELIAVSCRRGVVSGSGSGRD